MYRFIRKLFFLLDAEKAHYLAMDTLKILCSIPIAKKIIGSITSSNIPLNSFPLFGLNFKNRVGLGAGFDKNARYLRELETLGFGFVEIGTVTPKPQAGNDKPRLFRLTEDKALINRMGFNNDGVDQIVTRLQKWQVQKRKNKSNASQNIPLLIGGNIGKNKITPNEEAWKDYEICFKALHPYVDFFVVNVSSPNTPGLRELQEKESLKKILTHLQLLNKDYQTSKPILLKIAPDLSIGQLDDIINLALEINLDGLVAANTTINRNGLLTNISELNKMGNGGLSGKPLEKKSSEIIKYITQKTSGKIPIIASGGIFTASDAAEKWKAGAALVEVWTGFIYEGPMIVKRITSSLL